MTTFNMNQIRLEDVAFFCDSRLDKINVYSLTFVTTSIDFEDIIASIYQSFKKISCVQMIQQMESDFVRFTFVSHISAFEFSRLVHIAVEQLERIYKCKINVL